MAVRNRSPRLPNCSRSMPPLQWLAQMLSPMMRLRRKETTMEKEDIERIAARVVEKMLEPATRGMLAIAIARELRQMGLEYKHDMARLGERLDAQHF